MLSDWVGLDDSAAAKNSVTDRSRAKSLLKEALRLSLDWQGKRSSLRRQRHLQLLNV
jgi:hypothetical protein